MNHNRPIFPLFFWHGFCCVNDEQIFRHFGMIKFPPHGDHREITNRHY